MKLFLFFFSIFIFWKSLAAQTCKEKNHITNTGNGLKIQTRMDGDYILQSLMTLTAGGNCTRVTPAGFFRVYGVKFAVEKINEDNNILPNITLGLEINDGCLSVPITMSRGIEIVRNHRRSFCTRQHNYSCETTIRENKGQDIAVIGAYYSYATLPLASLLSLHNIPQISYGSSSSLLSKKNVYPSFYRTIPSDKNQVNVFIEILKSMNWTYVFIVGSDDDYGKLAIAYMKQAASNNGICIAGDMYISHDTDKTKLEAKKIVEKIQADTNVKVVLMFGYAKGMADELLHEAQNANMSRFWLTSEGWNPHILKVNAPPQQLKSVLTISLVKGKLPEFSNYLKEIVIRDYKCNIWLNLLIAQTFNCNVTAVSQAVFTGRVYNGPSKPCFLPVSTVTDYLQSENPDQVNNLIDAVYALAYSINAVVRERCQDRAVYPCIPYIDGQTLTKELTNVSFINLQNKTVQFEENGDIKGVEYSIENLQRDERGHFNYHPVGDWIKTRETKLQLDADKIQWPAWFKNDLKSQCGRTCQPGEYVVGKRDCCWECTKCPDNAVSYNNNSQECLPCQIGYHTLDNIECVITPVLYVSVNSSIGIIIVTISCIGFLTTLVCCIGYWLKQHAHVIASRGAFVTIAGFITLFALFLFTPFFVVYPTKTTCTLKQAYFSITFVSYSSLLCIQNNSIIRFLLKSIKDKQKYESMARCSLVFFLMLLQGIVLVIWVFQDTETVDQHYSKNMDEILEVCKEGYSLTQIFMTAYPCLVLLIATIAAFPERKYKGNYCISKYLNYTCLASCIVLLSYLFTFKQVEGWYQALVFAITIDLYGFVYLMCMVIPRLYWAFVRKLHESGHENAKVEKTEYSLYRSAESENKISQLTKL